MKRTIIHWQLPGRSEPQACAVRTVADDDALQRDAERLAEAERALRHVLSSAQTGTYDGGVVISFAALSAVRAVTPESASFQPNAARQMTEAECVIDRARRIMRGEGVEDQGQAWDRCLRLLDSYVIGGVGINA